MIRFEHVSFRYAGASAPTLRDVSLEIPEGELCLVVGRTGSGKSTLLGAVNGLVPHFTGGTLSGRVTVAGRDTRDHPPRELADVVGVIGQDPASGFVTDVVEEELAYGMESLGLAPDVMRRRVEETIDLLSLAGLRSRALSTLSGGERQRVAIGSVLAAHPAVLVLDEPTSALDPAGAEEVLATLHRLVHDLGITVLLAEHRLERVVPFVDRIVHLPGDGAPVEVDTPRRILATCPIAPPVVELARLVGWDPVPLTIREARRHAPDLRTRLAELATPDRSPQVTTGDRGLVPERVPVATVSDLHVRYGDVQALRGIDLEVVPGTVVALMGRNGAGKTSLLRALTGLVRPQRGSVRLGGEDPVPLTPRQLVMRVGFVPQNPADLLYAETVAAECRAADRDAGLEPGTCATLLDRLVPGLDPEVHPRDLSEGQRLGLVLAIVLSADPPLLLLDEPTRGLDYRAKTRLVEILRAQAARGRAIVLATHDVELAAAVSHRSVVVAEGEVVVDGPTSEVVVGSPAFAPQVAKVLTGLPWLTVDEVAASLAVAP